MRKRKGEKMSSEANKALVRRWISEVFDEANADVFHELAAPSYVYRRPSYEDLSGAEVLELQRSMIGAVPDLNNTIESQVAEGDTGALVREQWQLGNWARLVSSWEASESW